MSPFLFRALVTEPTRTAAETLSLAYEQYATAMEKHCRFHIANAEVSKELVQDAFLRTWEYMQAGNRIDNMKTFLFRVMNNIIVDHVRRRKRKDEVSLEELQEKGFDPGRDDTEAMHRQLDFWKTMGELKTVEEYDLLVMRYVNGLRPTDIAQAKGVTANTIAVKLHRIVKNLTHKLKMKHSKPRAVAQRGSSTKNT